MMLLTDPEIIRLVQIIRRANVRDEIYLEAEQALLNSGDIARPNLVTLLADSDKVVRERATELLKKLGYG